MQIPLEDTAADIVGKAMRGLQITDEQVAAQAGVAAAAVASLREGAYDETTARAVAAVLHVGADALSAMGHKAWRPRPVEIAGLACFNTHFEDMTVNSYVVWDGRNKVAAAFDTGATCEPMLDLIRAERLTLRYIFLTHTHDDHVADLARFAAETKAEVWASELEPAPLAGAKTFKENAHFHLGPIAIKTLLTSGHSPGMTTYYLTGLSWPLAVVGDAIFASSMGGSATHFAEQYRNNREKILTLPRDTVLACGHGPVTTLGQEKQHNPFFAR